MAETKRPSDRVTSEAQTKRLNEISDGQLVVKKGQKPPTCPPLGRVGGAYRDKDGNIPGQPGV